MFLVDGLADSQKFKFSRKLKPSGALALREAIKRRACFLE